MARYLVVGNNGIIEKKSLSFEMLPPEMIIRTIDYKYFTGKTKHFEKDATFDKEALGYVEGVYKDWGKFGHYKDIICFEFKDDEFISCRIDFIGNLGFPRPQLAADILPFVKRPDGQWLFVGIVRKDNNGRALIGGFREKDGLHFSTGIETCIKEANEEAGLVIDPLADLVDNYRHKDTLPVRLSLGENGPRCVRSVIMFLGDYYTSEGRQEIHEKRVDATTAYCLFAELQENLTPSNLKKLLRPKKDEDAKEVFVIKIKDLDSAPDFIFGHHTAIFKDALDQLSVWERYENNLATQ
jgi:hypothetical protein